ncbi:MAG: glycosyltransferase family 4 protein [Myxococcales bacterium]|nr:glycosyltransferase family 4 protein [Myxococcales bacterium]MDH3844942.1 glycosyltransferase family 4 protein [Myxococcales bacterium]
MKIAYLMNSYPMTSTTFIRREIHALEELGVEVKRFAVRSWSEQLVDPRDIDERDKTTYLLTGNTVRLLWSFAKELATNPWGLAKAVAAAFKLWRAAGRDFIKHVAYLLEAISLRQRLDAAGLRHVHVHFATNATTVAMLCRVLGGSTYSFTVHGPDELVEPYRLSYDLKIDNAAFVAAISNFCRVQLARFGGAHHWDKIEIVPCALDLDEFERAPNAVSESNTFVCIGRLCHQKAQTLIPDAIEPLVAGFPDLKVILVGDGETRGEIEDKIAKKGLGGHFELVGWRSNEEVRSILRGARAMLLPSFAEGLPVSIMEAFALGKPVISTYIAGIPELVDGSCGWIVPAGDIEALTAALKNCLMTSEFELLKMGEIGRARVEARHDIRRSATILRDCFQAHAEPRR